MSEEESSQKMENLILQLNKSGLSYLTSGHFGQAIEYFKKAERSVTEQLKINPTNPKMNQLAGITFNNMACYYKKNGKPKVALGYLKKALQLEVYKVQDWVSTASTHINICAIYSYLGKHQQSAEHAELAITMLDKVDTQKLKEGQSDSDKSYWNIKMLSHYNLAVELEHLKHYPQSKQQYQKAKEAAQINSKKNENLKSSIQESIQRIEEADREHKKKLMQILAKKRIQDEKGNHDFMRRNKKNYGDQSEWRAIIQTKKYQLYKTENSGKRNYQSTEKVKKLAPLNDGSRSKRGLQPV